MIDWTTVIISTLGGVSITGIFGSIFFYRENKKRAKAEAAQAVSSAKKEDASAAKELLDVLNGTKEFMEKMNKYNEEVASRLLGLLKEKDASLDEERRKNAENGYKIASCERKIKGLENKLAGVLPELEAAYKDICFVKDCGLRRPPEGTYKKEAV